MTQPKPIYICSNCGHPHNLNELMLGIADFSLPIITVMIPSFDGKKIVTLKIETSLVCKECGCGIFEEYTQKEQSQ